MYFMSNKLSLSVVSLLSCLGLVGQIALAAPVATQPLAPSQLNNLQEFKLQPRFSVWGFTGDTTLAEGLFLAPVYGDQTRALYLTAEGNYVKNDSSWLGGAGLGYRQIVNNHIWGGYALADYVSTPHNGFTVINPGLEMLGNVWDINVNGYIPLDNKKKLGKAGWAGDAFGDYEYTRPTGHDYYDHYIQQYEEPGRGFDFEVARVIPRFEDAKLHLGFYHFDTSDSGSTNGIEARLTYDLNQYSGIEIEDNYDNTKHNQFLIGVRFTLGDYSKEEKKQYGLASRLMDPIENDHVVLNSSGVIPVKKYEDQGEKKEFDNVWYFKPKLSGSQGNLNAVEGDGTAEKPFEGFTPDNFKAIDPNLGTINKYPLMYFTKGDYTFDGFDSRGIDYRFHLPNGWGMYGKTDDYTAPITAGEKAKFYGGVDILDSNEPTTLNSIAIINSRGEGPENAALYIRNSSNVIIQNTDIINTTSATIGPKLSTDFTMTSYGIYVTNGKVAFEKLNESTSGENNIVGEVTAAVDAEAAYGIYADAASAVEFEGGKTTVKGETLATANSESFGIYAGNDSTIKFSNPATEKVTVDADGNTQYGIYAVASASIKDAANQDMTASTIEDYVLFPAKNNTTGAAMYLDGKPDETTYWEYQFANE